MFRISLSAIALIGTISLSSSAACAERQTVFKCIDPAGGIAYQAVACKPGSREQVIAIAPAPPPSASPEYSRPTQGEGNTGRAARSTPRQAVIQSYECRTRSGALFYRHDRCPASIDRRSSNGGPRSGARESVQARRMSRLEACRGMRSVGRDGREFDDVVSTYDRNLGRDPCRRY